MPANRKLFVHNTLVELSFRTEQGLPLIATPYIVAILRSVFARAQQLYPVTISLALAMANHLHMLVIVRNPGCIPAFVEYIKRESAHAINHLRGKKKLTVWANGYDSPIILDADKAIERIVYMYTNPQRANLVKTIDEYPNFSTWSAFLNGHEESHCRRIPRESITQLPQATMSLAAQEDLAKELLSQGREEAVLLIEPDAWMQCFDELSDKDPEEINRLIIELIRKEEQRLTSTRKAPVVGAHALRLQCINTEYEPKKRGKRMLCLSSLRVLRVAYISFFREHCAGASAFGRSWNASDWLSKLPPGLFAPSGVLVANLLPMFVPTANNVFISA